MSTRSTVSSDMAKSHNTTTRKTEASKSKKARKVLAPRAVIFFTLLFCLSAVIGWAGAGAVDLLNALNSLDGEEGSGGFLPGLIDFGNLPERINVLVIGCDNRPGEQRARSDVLMLAGLDRKTGRVAVISIPRDTRVDVPGCGYNKINAAYAVGGAKLSCRVVEKLLDVKIPYYVVMDFNGFKGIIDTLGGVTLDVEQRMYYPEEDINLYPGVQRLNGSDALAYVRFRHYLRGDIDRIEKQKKFLLALADEVLEFKTVTRLPKLIPQIQNCVQTNFTSGEMLALARYAPKLNAQEMVLTTLPGDFLELEQGSYWQAKEHMAKGLLDRLLQPGAEVPKWQMATIDKRPKVETKETKDGQEATEQNLTGDSTGENTTGDSLNDSNFEQDAVEDNQGTNSKPTNNSDQSSNADSPKDNEGKIDEDTLDDNDGSNNKEGSSDKDSNLDNLKDNTIENSKTDISNDADSTSDDHSSNNSSSGKDINGDSSMDKNSEDNTSTTNSETGGLDGSNTNDMGA